MNRLFDFLHVRDLPYLARRNYVLELRHMFLWGMFANLVDGSFSSIVAAKTFHASPLLISVVWATPMLAHVLSLAWGVLVRGRPKIRMFCLLALGAIVSAASIALTPTQWHPWGGWLFAAQIAASRIFLSGLVTVRTSLWNANYPLSHRARIAGRIQKLSALLMLIMLLSASSLFDRHPEFYRIVYPAAAVLGVLALLPLRSMIVRGESREIRNWRLQLATRGGGPDGPWQTLRAGLSEALTILRTNRPFARYCQAMYFLGSANFMVDPVLTIVLTQTLHLSYFHSSLLMDQLPSVVALLTMGLWARLFDGVGVPRFRVINSLTWLLAILFTAAAVGVLAVGGAAAGPLVLGLLLVGRVFNGVGRGGGAIAWNLGHLHYAGRHDAELYMGIHVTLTGLRGMLMTFVGIWLYKQIGWASLLLAVGMGMTAVYLFRRLVAEEAAREATSNASAPAAADLSATDSWVAVATNQAAPRPAAR